MRQMLAPDECYQYEAHLEIFLPNDGDHHPESRTHTLEICKGQQTVQTNSGDTGKKYSPCLSPGLDEQKRNTASPCIVIPSAFFLRISVRASYGWMDMMDFAVITLQYSNEEEPKTTRDTYTAGFTSHVRVVCVSRS